MTNHRLNNLFLHYAHSDKLELLEIAKDFVSVNKRMNNDFGNFNQTV